MVAEPVKIAPLVRVLEPMVPPLTVIASATSLSAQGLAVFTQFPVIVSFWEREAGPPAPQSREMKTSSVPEAAKAKWAGLNDREATLMSWKTPVSLTSRLAEADDPAALGTQLKVPPFHCKTLLPVQAVSPPLKYWEAEVIPNDPVPMT